MDEAARLSNLIGTIYDAALDANLWHGALGAICEFMPACVANMFYQDSANHAVMVFYAWGEDPEYTQIYRETYAPLNPLFPAASFLDVGVVKSVGDMMPIDEFTATRFYRDWVEPQGYLDAIYANLERTSTGAAAFAVRKLARDGLYTDTDKERFRLIIPHVRRAVSIGRVIEFYKAGQKELSKTLDALTAAVVLVMENGGIVFANEAASALIERGAVLRMTNNKLSAVDARVELELRDAIASASRGDGHLGVKGIAIALAGNSHVAHVLSLTSGNRSDPTNGRATAALFIRPITVASPVALELVAKSCDLTATETRVLSVVSETGGIDEIATQLGIGKATVKTHLNRLFAKTGTKRQADLIRLLAGYSNSVSP